MTQPLIPYIIRQGDYLTKLAYQMGFDAEAVWKDPKNEELVKLRGSPDVLQPGDILHVPAPKRTWLPIARGTTNRYVATVPKVVIKVVFQQADGAPIADEPYELRGLPGEPGPSEIKTDGDGMVELTVPVHVREVDVFFPRRNEVYRLGVGDMDPHAETTGVRKRLENLGYLARRPWAPDEEMLAAAILRFQQDHGLPSTGALDDATREALGDTQGG